MMLNKMTELIKIRNCWRHKRRECKEFIQSGLVDILNKY